MTVTTEHFLNGTGSATTFAYTFPYYKTSDIKVKVGGTLKTEGSHYNVTGTNIVFTSGNLPPSGTGNVHIYRETDVDTSKATFAAGSSIRATDLNNNETQLLYAAQEQNFNTIQTADIQDGAITSAKILDGTIATADIADNAINAAKIAADAVGSSEIAADAVGASELANNAVDTNAILDDAVTSAKIGTAQVIADSIGTNAVTTAKLNNTSVTADKLASNSVITAKIDTGAVTAAKIGTDAVTTAKILDNNITTAKIANDAITADKMADNSVDSQHYVDGSIDTVHIKDAQVTTDKLATNSVTNAKIADNAIDSDNYVDGSIDTAHLSANAVTTAKIATDAVTGSKIAANQIDSPHYVDGSIDTVHIGDAQVTYAKLAGDAVNGNIIADNSINSEHYVDGSIDTAHIGNAQVTYDKLAGDAVNGNIIADDSIDSEHYIDGSIDTAHLSANAVTTAKIENDRLKTLTGMESGTASVLASSTALTSSTAELNLLDGKSVVTSVSGSSTDVQLPTAKAVNDQIVALMQDAGGYFPIANEVSFPNTNPDPNDDAGTIVSIADAGGVVVNGSGVSTTGRTLGGATVTINGIDSSLNSTTIAAGKGMLVQTTSTLNTYTYHRLVVDEAGVAAAQTLVSDFNQRYRVGSSNPTSSLDDGDLFFNTSSDKMLVYNATGSSWDEVQSIGNFYIATFSEAFDGSRTAFTVSNAPTNAQQLLISINGVVQKPNAGTGAPSEGFTLSSSTVTFSSAPATGSDSFIVVLGSTVNIGTPSNNTVSTAVLQNSAVTTDKLGTDAVTGAKIADDAVGAEHIENLDGNVLFLDNAAAQFGTGNDLQIHHTGSHSYINQTAGSGDLYIRQYGTSNSILFNGASSEQFAKFTHNGSCELYYDNSKKFETTSSGVTCPGHLQIDAQAFATGGLKVNADNIKLRVGAGDDLEIYHDGTHSKITNATNDLDIVCTGDDIILQAADDISLKPQGGEAGVLVFGNGDTQLYYDNSLKFATTSTGVAVTGKLSLTDDFSGGDNVVIRLGNAATGDLNIFHDGTNTMIDNETGDLKISSPVLRLRGDQVSIMDEDQTEGYINCYKDGAVKLYYDNSLKFETNSGGITVTGGANFTSGNVSLVDNSKIKLGTGDDLEIYHDGSNSYVRDNGGGDLILKGSEVRIQSGNSTDTKALFKNDGAVELYHDNVKTFATTSTGIDIFGPEGGDANCHLIADEGDDNADWWKLKAQADGLLRIQNYTAGSWETNIECAGNGAVKLDYDNSTKLETQSTGAKVTGDLRFADNGTAIFGDGNDSQIKFTGTDTTFTSAGKIQLYPDGDLEILDNSSGEARAKFIDNGAVELYYNNEKTLETTASGAKILNTDGSADLYIIGSEGQGAQIYFHADDGDDASDKWRFDAEAANSKFHFAMFHTTAWQDVWSAGLSNNNYPWFRGPVGGIRFDDNLANTSANWGNYDGDGHLHRTDGQAYCSSDDYYRFRKNGTSENKRFEFRTDTGNAGAQNDWQDDQFDFAEMFEWSDGNPDNQDRIGNTVAVDGLTGKIKIAETGDTVIGVVSGTAAFTANCASMQWQGAYLRDEWGRLELELVKDEDGNQLYNDPDNGNVRPKVNLKQNPDWDESQSYHRREDRKEWDKIGIIGQCYVRKTAVIPSSWIKLKEIDSTKDFYLIK